MLARLADKQAGAKALRLKNDPGAVRPRAAAETQEMGGAGVHRRMVTSGTIKKLLSSPPSQPYLQVHWGLPS